VFSVVCSFGLVFISPVMFLKIVFVVKLQASLEISHRKNNFEELNW